MDRILLTHEHCDHCAGAEELRKRFACPILTSKACAKGLLDGRRNYSHYFEALCGVQTSLQATPCAPMQEFVLTVEETFQGMMSFSWEGHSITITETPGHSAGSACICVDASILFSGDTLLEKQTITRFIGGSRKKLETVTVP